ncbi:hypothetical protein F1559_000506 [Cyanidiococcus yangmingshanensis]|uniref:Uncharacterized protein n=1 Tax=Cyanidiococcus yangmingshanensis TaxID=2690220 RepID=A0A7J7IPP3_9RHOD|nr:hypothetical protein F1559_000506 [Cyanidiococcus yangmingshanensis]
MEQAPSASSREHQLMSSQLVASRALRTEQPRVSAQASSSNAVAGISRNQIVSVPVPKELETGRGTTQRNPSPTKPYVRRQTPKESGRRGLQSETPAEWKEAPAKSGRHSVLADTAAQKATVPALHPLHAATSGSNKQVQDKPQQTAFRSRSVAARVPSRGEILLTEHSTRKERETIRQTSVVPSLSRGCRNGTSTERQRANAETTKRPSPALTSEVDTKSPSQRPEESRRTSGPVRTGSVSARPPDSGTAQVPPPASPSLHRSPGILSRRLSRSPEASPETGLPAVVHEDVVSVTAPHDAMLNKRCTKRVAAQLLHDRQSSNALNMAKGPALMPRPSTTGTERGSAPDALEGRGPQASSSSVPSPAARETTDTKAPNQTTVDASTKETNGYLPRLRRLRERVQKARALAEATWNREDLETESSI